MHPSSVAGRWVGLAALLGQALDQITDAAPQLVSDRAQFVIRLSGRSRYRPVLILPGDAGRALIQASEGDDASGCLDRLGSDLLGPRLPVLDADFAQEPLHDRVHLRTRARAGAPRDPPWRRLRVEQRLRQDAAERVFATHEEDDPIR